MEKVVERGNVRAAVKRVRRHKGSLGVDGRTVEEIADVPGGVRGGHPSAVARRHLPAEASGGSGDPQERGRSPKAWDFFSA